MRDSALSFLARIVTGASRRRATGRWTRAIRPMCPQKNKGPSTQRTHWASQLLCFMKPLIGLEVKMKTHYVCVRVYALHYMGKGIRREFEVFLLYNGKLV